MKKFRIIHLILGLFSLSFLASCVGNDEESNAPQDEIVGSWRGQSILFTVDGLSLRDYVKKLYADLGIPITDEELDAFTEETEFDDEALASVLEFKSDGTLLITNNEDGTVESGTWVISGNTLTIDDGDDAGIFTIERLTGSELHLLAQLDEDVGLGLEGSEDAVIRWLFTFTR